MKFEYNGSEYRIGFQRSLEVHEIPGGVGEKEQITTSASIHAGPRGTTEERPVCLATVRRFYRDPSSPEIGRKHALRKAMKVHVPEYIVASGKPLDTIGQTNDMYVDSGTGNVYGPKTGGQWGGIVSNIKPKVLSGENEFYPLLSDPKFRAAVWNAYHTRTGGLMDKERQQTRSSGSPA